MYSKDPALKDAFLAVARKLDENEQWTRAIGAVIADKQGGDGNDDWTQLAIPQVNYHDAFCGTISLPLHLGLLYQSPLLRRLRRIDYSPIMAKAVESFSLSRFSLSLHGQQLLGQVLQRQTWLDHRREYADPNAYAYDDCVIRHALAFQSMLSFPENALFYEVLAGTLKDRSCQATLCGVRVASIMEAAIQFAPVQRAQLGGNWVQALLTAAVMQAKPFRSWYGWLWKRAVEEIGSTNLSADDACDCISNLVVGRPHSHSDRAGPDLLHSPIGTTFVSQVVRLAHETVTGIPLTEDWYVRGLRLHVDVAYGRDGRPVGSRPARIARFDTLDPHVYRQLRVSYNILQEGLCRNANYIYSRHRRIEVLKQLFKTNTEISTLASRIPAPAAQQVVAKAKHKRGKAAREGTDARGTAFFMINEKFLLAPRLQAFCSPEELLQGWEEEKQIKRALFRHVFQIITQRRDAFVQEFVEFVLAAGPTPSRLDPKLASICVVSSHDGRLERPIFDQFLQLRDGRSVYIELIYSYDRSDLDDIPTIYFWGPADCTYELALCMEQFVYRYFKVDDITVLSKLTGSINLGTRLLTKPLSEHEFLIRPRFDLEQMVDFLARDFYNARDALQRAREKLAQRNFFGECPVLLPLDNQMKGRLDRLESQIFNNYHGSYGLKVDLRLLCTFVEQFPKDFRAEAISMLEQVQVLSKQDSVSLLEALQKSHDPTADGAVRKTAIVPLTRTSGAALLRSFEKPINRQGNGWQHFDYLSDCLTAFKGERDARVVFVDDNCISGTQLEKQLRFWCEPHKRNSIQDDNISRDLLTEDQIAQLKGSDVTFYFVMSRREAETRADDLFGTLQTKHWKFRYVHEFITLNARPEFREYLMSIGRQVYAAKVRGQSVSDEVIANRALGFDNLGGLFLSMDNAPTSLVTALWCPGVVTVGTVDRAWRPLFLRAGSEGNIVL